MIPAAFSYERPTTVADAVAALAASGGSAKVIAGGQSLLGLMKLRLASPEALVDIGRIAELKGHGATADGGYELGAMTTYAEVLRDTGLGFAKDCLESIGDVQVRNMGTVGGAVAHADPAADAPALALALDYSAVIRGPRGERTVPLDGFFVGPFQTGLEADEILVKLVRGPLPAGASGAYRKLQQPASGYSMVGIAAVVAQAGGSITHARVAVTGVGDHPYRAKAVEAALIASDGSAASVAAAAAHVTDGVTVSSDIHADRDYRAHMAVVYTRRAIDAALGR